jgi:hypothetical protein
VVTADKQKRNAVNVSFQTAVAATLLFVPHAVDCLRASRTKFVSDVDAAFEHNGVRICH